MNFVRKMPKKSRAVACLLGLLALLLAACGSEETAGPGDDPPKRALDPRIEALRYFPATTEAIGLLESSDAVTLAQLDDSLEVARSWRDARRRAADSLREAGVDPNRILELSRRPAVDIDLPPPEIVFGTVPGAGSGAKRTLIVLATEQGVEMDLTFREAAEAGNLESAGEFDGARLYRGPGLDFAVRDGVLIAADSINRLQQAITRRDGDGEGRLDDAAVTGLLNELPEPGTLRAYLAAGDAADALLRLITEAILEPERPEPEELPSPAEAAVSVYAEEGGRLAIEVIVRADRSDELEDDTEDSSAATEEGEPVPVSISASALRDALSLLPEDSPLRRLVFLAPLAGAAWVDGDDLRARLVTAE